MKKEKGTYVYCVVAADRRPRLARVPAGLPGAGPVRLLDVGQDLFIAVADLPLARYSEAAINRGLANLDWISRVAVAHEAAVESFIASAAERRELASLRRVCGRRCAIIQTPLSAPPPRGVRALDRWAQKWISEP